MIYYYATTLAWYVFNVLIFICLGIVYMYLIIKPSHSFLTYNVYNKSIFAAKFNHTFVAMFYKDVSNQEKT